MLFNIFKNYKLIEKSIKHFKFNYNLTLNNLLFKISIYLGLNIFLNSK
jgi:hypothetical protein